MVTGAVGWDLRRTVKVPEVVPDSSTLMVAVETITPTTSSLVMVTVAALPLVSCATTVSASSRTRSSIGVTVRVVEAEPTGIVTEVGME